MKAVVMDIRAISAEHGPGTVQIGDELITMDGDLVSRRSVERIRPAVKSQLNRYSVQAYGQAQ
jgi:hypothetical protein